MSKEPARSRKSADDRRKQLIGIGLQLLVSTPIHELSIDAVAAEAGISRGLLFHYFPTKRDYYLAVVAAATRRILKQAQLPETGDPRSRLHAVTHGFVSFVQRRRANYTSLVRGASGDDAVQAIVSDLRRTLAERALEAAGAAEPSALEKLAAQGWLAMAEEMAICATDGVLELDDLVAMLLRNFERTVVSVGAMEGSREGSRPAPRRRAPTRTALGRDDVMSPRRAGPPPRSTESS